MVPLYIVDIVTAVWWCWKCVQSDVGRSVFRNILKFVKSDYWLCHGCLSVWNSLVPTGRIIMKFNISVFFEYIYQENSRFIKIGQELRVLNIKTTTSTHFWSYLA